MTTPAQRRLIESRHPLSPEDEQVEHPLVAALVGRFETFAGTPREAYDAITVETPMAEGVSLERIEQHRVGGWWLRPAAAPSDRAILFLHGGAYLLGSATAYRGFVSQIAIRAGVSAFVADYPLAPEHPFPAALDGVLAVWNWLQAQGIDQFALVGDSAGGGLALAALAEKSVNHASIASMVVFSPWVDLALNGESFTHPHTHDPVFKPATLAMAAKTYLAGADPKDGRASPLYRLPETLPPLAIQVGTDELLLDDSRRYAALAAEKGGEVRLDIFEGMHHVFQRSTTELQSARRALDAAANFLSTHWKS